MDLQERINNLVTYITEEWPDIADKQGCAKFVLRNLNPRSEQMSTLDNLCCYFMRHEGDF